MKKLNEGDPAPPINALDQDGNRFTLGDFKGKKLVLYFYPKDDTPGCTAEACNLRDHYGEFLDQGFEIIGVSADSEGSHKKFKKKYNLPFRLISDVDKKILEDYGAWGEKKMYGKVYEGILRKTYVIDENGIIIKIIDKVKTKEHSRQIFQELSH
ncbi:MAG: thioredoxin-dependent thiol peroxidase [Bacteroidales bacterium]|nr:thioredoxin-dependent thiol peroxidase [Bacteroidales bacterium]MBN2698329.1 thioredoxin-dependent thiol peroxidase [Bacteroidales bacterium]